MQFIHNGTYICDVKNPPDIVAQPGHIRLYVVEKEILPVFPVWVVVGIVTAVVLGLTLLISMILAVLYRRRNSKPDYTGWTASPCKLCRTPGVRPSGGRIRAAARARPPVHGLAVSSLKGVCSEKLHALDPCAAGRWEPWPPPCCWAVGALDPRAAGRWEPWPPPCCWAVGALDPRAAGRWEPWTPVLLGGGSPGPPCCWAVGALDPRAAGRWEPWTPVLLGGGSPGPPCCWAVGARAPRAAGRWDPGSPRAAGRWEPWPPVLLRSLGVPCSNTFECSNSDLVCLECFCPADSVFPFAW
uniref:myelin protein zero-like protein 1 isoform X1 n=1 Tax=Halichoerus grypus TaxID=9711 RepID=UPI001659738D|nr:myelin protein zero-like protein 1 isoform X1 [Halichoerus grypus]